VAALPTIKVTKADVLAYLREHERLSIDDPDMAPGDARSMRSRLKVVREDIISNGPEVVEVAGGGG